MNRLFKLFLLILFISPLFGTAANATVHKVIFGYAPDWNNPTKVVEIERYYDDNTNMWYYDTIDHSRATRDYVEVPLEGTFSNAIPFVFNGKSNQYIHNTTNLIDAQTSSTIQEDLSIACERTLTNANTLICKWASDNRVAGYYGATYWAKNKATSSAGVLYSISLPGTGPVYSNYVVRYSSRTSSLTPSIFQSFAGSRATLTMVSFDTNNPGVVCEYPKCDTFIGSFSVVDSNMQKAGLTDVGYNQETSCTAGRQINSSVTISRPAIYCDYNSATDTNPICRIDYTRVSFSAQPVFCSVGGISLESPSPSDPIIIKNPITTNTTVITIPTCFNMTVKLADNIQRYISYAPSTQKYYSSSNCKSGTEFKNNEILLELDASQDKIPVSFSNSVQENISETSSSWSTQNQGVFYCDHDSNNSKTQLVCNFATPPTQNGLIFYPSAYATLDDRALSIGGTVAQRLVSYCNPLTISGNKFYSKYDNNYAIHWYSDNKCTSELTGDFPLQYDLPSTAVAAPVWFYPTGSVTTYISDDATYTNTTNRSPIFCEYNSDISSTAVKCKYSTAESAYLPGGQLAAPNAAESYEPRIAANFVEGKSLSITTDSLKAEITVKYTTKICNTISLKYQNSNYRTDVESNTLYWNGETWCKQSGCTDCGYSDKDVLTNSAGYYPAYFSLQTTDKAYKVFSSDQTDVSIGDTNPKAVTCMYENGELSCNISKDTNLNLIAYVFVAPNLLGAMAGGALNNFSTSGNYITVKYKPAKCSDYVKVHFYGFNGTGGYVDLPGRDKYVKYFYESGQWADVNGAYVNKFADLGIVHNIINPVTVSATEYTNGLSAYRAAYVGGVPESITPTDDIVIEKTTGIVESTTNPYDIMVAGISLPTIPENMLYNEHGQVKDIYYKLLYAANCLDPNGAESAATCVLDILPNGRALYKNQCLPGWKGGNFGDNELTNILVTPSVLQTTNECSVER